MFVAVMTRAIHVERYLGCLGNAAVFWDCFVLQEFIPRVQIGAQGRMLFELPIWVLKRTYITAEDL